ncbi:MAG TPA: hypothetical protein ENI73_10155 [Spirochaetes bacterium]|nr:hypothetical protein [Spirochaetota bacterium]
MRKIILAIVVSFFLFQLFQCTVGNIKRGGQSGGAPRQGGNEQRALNHLRKAQAALKRASRNKGGHRVRALKKTNQAIRQLR